MSTQLKRVVLPLPGSGGGSTGGGIQNTVNTVGDLPTIGNSINDLRYVVSEEEFYRWTGSEWVTNESTATSSKFMDEFVEADFVLNSTEYWLTYQESTHLKGTNPVVQVLELSSGQYSSVIVTVEITNAGLVRIRVPSSPDLRFSGKIIIA